MTDKPIELTRDFILTDLARVSNPKFLLWLMANAADGKDCSLTYYGKTYTAKPGQYCSTLTQMALDYMRPPSAVQRALYELKRLNLIDVKSVAGFYTITLQCGTYGYSDTCGSESQDAEPKENVNKTKQRDEDTYSNNIFKTTTPPTACACACEGRVPSAEQEREWLDQCERDLQPQQIWEEQVRMYLRRRFAFDVLPSRIAELFGIFRAETEARQKLHNSMQDLRSHFLDWLRYHRANKPDQQDERPQSARPVRRNNCTAAEALEIVSRYTAGRVGDSAPTEHHTEVP